MEVVQLQNVLKLTGSGDGSNEDKNLNVLVPNSFFEEASIKLIDNEKAEIDTLSLIAGTGSSLDKMFHCCYKTPIKKYIKGADCFEETMYTIYKFYR
eukprot:UN04293